MPDGSGGTGRPLSAAAVLVYDGECRLCRRSAAWIRRRDRAGAIELLPYQDPTLRERFPELPIERCRESIQLLTPGGGRVEGAAALEATLRLLPGVRRLAPGFRIPGVRPLADSVYRQVARRRHLGCGTHCSAPD
jgi:predicted DCC family thiol-disulfide oxidoreductase YuxK